MGINNIHILIEPDTNRQALQVQAALQEQRVAEHRAGMHPYGSMRRDCPLCQGR